MLFETYHRLILRTSPAIETFTGARWDMPSFGEVRNLCRDLVWVLIVSHLSWHIDTCRASAYPENRMEVNLTPDQKAFVRQAIESGRLHREEEAVQEALSLWEERERTRAEILTAVNVAEASIERGEGRTITQESMRQLADEVKQRGRGRLAAEQSSPR
jgi:putative addiction module CopG family antidote